MSANSSQCTGTSELHLRPHHLLCLQTFIGRGYSEEFIEHMTLVKKQLTTNPRTPITLVSGAWRRNLHGSIPHQIRLIRLAEFLPTSTSLLILSQNAARDAIGGSCARRCVNHSQISYSKSPSPKTNVSGDGLHFIR